MSRASPPAAGMPEPSPQRGGRAPLSWRQGILLVHWVLMFVGTHWPEINRYKPETGWPVAHFSEAIHLTLYTAWGVLWWWVLIRRPPGATSKWWWWVVVGGFCYACFDEMTQLLVGRSGKFYDVLVDTVGLTAGVWLPEIIRRWRVATPGGVGQRDAPRTTRQ